MSVHPHATQKASDREVLAKGRRGGRGEVRAKGRAWVLGRAQLRVVVGAPQPSPRRPRSRATHLSHRPSKLRHDRGPSRGAAGARHDAWLSAVGGDAPQQAGAYCAALCSARPMVCALSANRGPAIAVPTTRDELALITDLLMANCNPNIKFLQRRQPNLHESQAVPLLMALVAIAEQAGYVLQKAAFAERGLPEAAHTWPDGGLRPDTDAPDAPTRHLDVFSVAARHLHQRHAGGDAPNSAHVVGVAGYDPVTPGEDVGTIHPAFVAKVSRVCSGKYEASGYRAYNRERSCL